MASTTTPPDDATRPTDDDATPAEPEATAEELPATAGAHQVEGAVEELPAAAAHEVEGAAALADDESRPSPSSCDDDLAVVEGTAEPTSGVEATAATLGGVNTEEVVDETEGEAQAEPQPAEAEVVVVAAEGEETTGDGEFFDGACVRLTV